MISLGRFLLDRIAEDECVAREAGRPPWHEWSYDEGRFGEVYHTESRRRSPNTEYLNGVTHDSEGITPAVDEGVGPHIARWDPARVLAECAAKRAIVEIHSPVDDDPEPFCWNCDEDGWPCATLRRLATVYADHPDYREEWRP